MSVDILGQLSAHPRTVIRRAACSLLEAAGFEGRAYPNQEEVWTLAQFPAAGVYTSEESPLDQDLHWGRDDGPDDRRLTLTVEILENYERQERSLDDRLDALSLIAEQALTFTAVRDAARAVGVDVLDLTWQGMRFDLADDGQTTVGCVTLTWSVEYRMPKAPGSIDLFVTGHIDWDLAGREGWPDGNLEATDIVTLPQDPPAADQEEEGITTPPQD